MAVTTQMRTQITQLYVSLFGRAPESDGLGYWVNQLDSGVSLKAIAQSMYSVEAARVMYPLYLTNDEIVAKFYMNVLGLITAGGYHTCAVLANGRVLCWGQNTQGQLGLSNQSNTYVPSTVVEPNIGSSPATYSPLGNVVAITAGNQHTCALTASGRVLCWGYNDLGECGRPATGLSPAGESFQVIGARAVFSGWNSSTSTGTPLSSTIVSISAGQDHTCAVAFNGESYCWGSNSFGQITTDLTVSTYRNAQSMSGRQADVLGLSAGGSTTCALHRSSSSGSAYVEVSCWGANNSFQTGDPSANSTNTILTPFVVQDTAGNGLIDTQVRVAVGNTFACALSFNGHVNCWGGNASGELGRGFTGSPSSTNGSAGPVVDLN